MTNTILTTTEAATRKESTMATYTAKSIKSDTNKLLSTLRNADIMYQNRGTYPPPDSRIVFTDNHGEVHEGTVIDTGPWSDGIFTEVKCDDGATRRIKQ